MPGPMKPGPYPQGIAPRIGPEALDASRPYVVQRTSTTRGNGMGTAPSTSFFPNPTTKGNAIIVVVVTNSFWTAASATDTTGNTYQWLRGICAHVNSQANEIFMCPNIVGGGCRVSLATNASLRGSFFAIEVAGLAQTIAIDSYTLGLTPFSSSLPVTASLRPQDPNAFVLSLCSVQSINDMTIAHAPASGWIDLEVGRGVTVPQGCTIGVAVRTLDGTNPPALQTISWSAAANTVFAHTVVAFRSRNAPSSAVIANLGPGPRPVAQFFGQRVGPDPPSGATTGTVTLAQGQTLDAAGLETVPGTASGAQGESVSSSGVQTITGTGVTAEGQTGVLAGIETVTATTTTAQGETGAATASEVIPGTVTTAQAETGVDSGLELEPGTAVTAEGEVVLASGTADVNTASVQTAQGETVVGAAGQLVTGTATTGQGQSAAAAGMQTVTGAIAGAEGESIDATGVQAIAGTLSTAESQTVTLAGSESLSGTGATLQGETTDGTGLGADLTVTATVVTAQGETTDGADTVAALSVGGGSSVRYYRRPTLTLPAKRPAAVYGIAHTAQGSAHSDATGALAYVPIAGYAITAAAQTSACIISVDTRIISNNRRARILAALHLKVA